MTPLAAAYADLIQIYDLNHLHGARSDKLIVTSVSGMFGEWIRFPYLSLKKNEFLGNVLKTKFLLNR